MSGLILRKFIGAAPEKGTVIINRPLTDTMVYMYCFTGKTGQRGDGDDSDLGITENVANVDIILM